MVASIAAGTEESVMHPIVAEQIALDRVRRMHERAEQARIRSTVRAPRRVRRGVVRYVRLLARAVRGAPAGGPSVLRGVTAADLRRGD